MAPALFQEWIFLDGLFGTGVVPPHRPDVKDDPAQRHRLNQSAAARCVTGRSHGYLAATATVVNVSCQRVTDENKRTEKTQVSRHTDWQTGTAVNLTAT